MLCLAHVPLGVQARGAMKSRQREQKAVSRFAKKRKMVFEHTCISFFQRKQEEGEPVASLVSDVYAWVKHCNFGALHDEMVRDILVSGIHNKRL